MGVPNTTSFSLLDVVNEVSPSSNDLQTCFDEANPNYFDDEYYLFGTKLLEFRNYGEDNYITISASPTSVSFDKYGTVSQTIIVTTTPTSSDFYVYSKPSWVNSPIPSRFFVLSADPLSSGSRSGTVVLRHNDNSSIEETISVSQVGGPL